MHSPIKISIKIGSHKIASNDVQLTLDVHSHGKFDLACKPTDFGDDGVVDASEIYDMMAKEASIVIENTKDSNDKMEFHGIVTDINIGKSKGSHDSIGISGKGKSTYIDDRGLVRTYSEMTLGDIAKKVLADFEGQLDINIANDKEIFYCVQYNETDFDFIARLAAERGQWFYFDGVNLVLGSYQSKHNFNMSLGHNMKGFGIYLAMPPLNLGNHHYDYLSDESYVVHGLDEASPSLGSYGDGALDASTSYYNRKPVAIYNQLYTKESDQKDFAKERVRSTASHMVELSGDSGNPGVSIGASIEVKDQKDKSLGKYFVKEVTHTWSGGGRYRNSYVAIPAELDCPPPSPKMRIPKASAQPAVVIENNDPEKLGRVRVQFPWQDKNEMTPWIRCVHPYAGSGDMYFVPELEDQVMVDFEFANPDRPYAIGSVYHGQKLPQYFDEDNTIKAIHTKCGHRLVFRDGDESTITLSTKDDTCQLIFNIDADGEISITSGGAINIKSKEIALEGDNLNLKMDSAINIEAGQDINIKGANVSINADQAVSIEGTEVKLDGQSEASVAGAQVKVEGQATTTIKGGMVQIN